MRILVEILHPAHVHFFRNALRKWRERGDEVLVLSRDKDVANQLLDAYGIPYTSLSKLGRHAWQLGVEMLVRDGRMLRHALRFSPDVLVGIMGVSIAPVARLLGRPAVVFYDTENATITNRFVYPLAHSVCTPQCYQGQVRGRHVTYPSYHELAYLHPRHFTPDPKIVARAGVDPNSTYFLLRFVSWQASHDLGEQGLGRDLQQRLVAMLQPHGRVLISSEQPLPKEFEALRFTAPPEDMHHFIAHARLLIGESATMASEAAVLGVPAFYIADTGRGYTDEQQARYGLVHNYKRSQSHQALAQIERLLAMPDLAVVAASLRHRLLQERIDTTEWMLRYLDSVVAARALGSG